MQNICKRARLNPLLRGNPSYPQPQLLRGLAIGRDDGSNEAEERSDAVKASETQESDIQRQNEEMARQLYEATKDLKITKHEDEIIQSQVAVDFG